MTIHQILRQRLLVRAGLAPAPSASERFAQLAKSEWSPRFESLMRNRLIMGALRYGPIGHPGKPAYDRVAGIQKRLNQFIQSGNAEFLVDIANLALLSFAEPSHPNFHWHDTHDDHCGLPSPK